MLTRLAEFVAEDEQPDHYGAGPVIEKLEKRVAGLLGKPAAAFMPSGTMAQQIALRLWADRRGLSVRLPGFGGGDGKEEQRRRQQTQVQSDPPPTQPPCHGMGVGIADQ